MGSKLGARAAAGDGAGDASDAAAPPPPPPPPDTVDGVKGEGLRELNAARPSERLRFILVPIAPPPRTLVRDPARTAGLLSERRPFDPPMRVVREDANSAKDD